MSWPDIVRGVRERIADCEAQDRELAALYRDDLMFGCDHAVAIAEIYRIATRALSEPSDTSALLEICTIIEGLG